MAAPRRSAAFVLQRIMKIVDSRQFPHGKRSAQGNRDRGQQYGESERRAVEPETLQERDFNRGTNRQKTNASPGDDSAKDRTGGDERKAFRQQLSRDAELSRT